MYLEAVRRRKDNGHQGAPGGGYVRLKFEPRAQPAFGPKFGWKVSHFIVQYGGKRAACSLSEFSRTKTSTRRILILNSETLTGAHSFILRRAANNFGKTLIGRRSADQRTAATLARRNTIGMPRWFVWRTSLVARRLLVSTPPASLKRPHNPTIPIFPQNQPISAHIGSLGRRRKRPIGETGDRIWELSFHIGTPDDKDNGRELAETLLDCLL